MSIPLTISNERHVEWKTETIPILKRGEMLHISREQQFHEYLRKWAACVTVSDLPLSSAKETVMLKLAV